MKPWQNRNSFFLILFCQSWSLRCYYLIIIEPYNAQTLERSLRSRLSYGRIMLWMYTPVLLFLLFIYTTFHLFNTKVSLAMVCNFYLYNSKHSLCSINNRKIVLHAKTVNYSRAVVFCTIVVEKPRSSYTASARGF